MTHSDDDIAMNCPDCGGSRRETNLIDEAPFEAMARDAGQLRRFGKYDAVAHVLNVLSAVRIENYLRLRWVCRDCRCRYDD